MLLIAIPKSAGTSLVNTIGKICNIKVSEGIGKGKYDIDCEDYYEIQKYHSIVPERSSEFLNKTTKSKYEIFREHLLPTNRHLKILEKINRRIIILLRNPEDIIDCYKRMKKSSLINFDLLNKDINNFYNSYFNWEYDKKLIIFYDDLIKKYNHTMDKIFTFWALKKPKKNISLLRKNYTGIGKQRLEENSATNWTT